MTANSAAYHLMHLLRQVNTDERTIQQVLYDPDMTFRYLNWLSLEMLHSKIRLMDSMISGAARAIDKLPPEDRKEVYDEWRRTILAEWAKYGGIRDVRDYWRAQNAEVGPPPPRPPPPDPPRANQPARDWDGLVNHQKKSNKGVRFDFRVNYAPSPVEQEDDKQDSEEWTKPPSPITQEQLRPKKAAIQANNKVQVDAKAEAKTQLTACAGIPRLRRINIEQIEAWFDWVGAITSSRNMEQMHRFYAILRTISEASEIIGHSSSDSNPKAYAYRLAMSKLPRQLIAQYPSSKDTVGELQQFIGGRIIEHYADIKYRTERGFNHPDDVQFSCRLCKVHSHKKSDCPVVRATLCNKCLAPEHQVGPN